jgi:hypothetical protein
VRSTWNGFIEAWKDLDKGFVGMGRGSSDALIVRTSSLNGPTRLLEQLGMNRQATRQYWTSFLKLGCARQAIGADRKSIFGCLEGKGRWFSRYGRASWSLSRDGEQPKWTGRVSRIAWKGTAGRPEEFDGHLRMIGENLQAARSTWKDIPWIHGKTTTGCSFELKSFHQSSERTDRSVRCAVGTFFL